MSVLVEIIIATYNRASLITETLDSILDQHEDILVRIEDDGSTDNTEQVLQPYLATGRVRYARHPPSGGPAVPRNRALRSVKAPYVVFFDADDLMNPGHLAHHVKLLETHPEWVAAVCDYRNFSEEGEASRTQFQSCPGFLQQLSAAGVEVNEFPKAAAFSERELKLLAVKENFSSACGVVYRSAIAQRLGGFDESLAASEDFDMFWRLLGEGSVGVSTFCAFRRRVHPGNMSNGYVKILTYKVQSRLKLLHRERDFVVRQSLRRSLAGFLDALGYNQMPLSLMTGFMSALKALRYGALPRQSLRAAARELLKGSRKTTTS